MEYQDLVIEREGDIAKVELNRPDSLNTLSVRMLQELIKAAEELRADATARVILLTGGTGMFSAGLDLKDPRVREMLAGTLEDRRERAALGYIACRAWEDLDAVTVAAVEGYCVGGGVSLAISCDFRIMGQSAFMRIPEVDLGLNYSWGSIPRLLHLIGPARTKQAVLLCERISADTCLSWGLADQVAPDGSAMAASETLAGKILSKPPIPVSMTKQAIRNINAALDRAGIYMDADQFVLTTYTEDHRKRLDSFLNKKKEDA